MLKKDLDDLEKNGQKGDWCFLNNDHQIALRYGEHVFTGMVILPISETKDTDTRHWSWNGNKEAPTLSPSIFIHPYPDWNDGWHGWLRDGKLVDA